jgi:hypothetical protein
VTVTLTNISSDGKPLEATFYPAKGMNLISYKKGGIEVIDTSTEDLFQDRMAGLGALIGPHFHHRPKDKIGPVPFEERFPHIKRVKERGIIEPFSHGIARYSSWDAQATKTSLEATLQSTTTLEGVLLSTLEGFAFTMFMDVELRPTGLYIELGVDACEPAVAGLHYYFSLGKGKNELCLQAREEYNASGQIRPVPSLWRESRGLVIPFEEGIDAGFFAHDPLQMSVAELKTVSHTLAIGYQSHTEEGSLQVFHPKGSSYICIEPLSATIPRSPKFLSSGINVCLEIL